MQDEVPEVLVQPVPAKPHVVPSSILCPPSVTALVPVPTAQLPPEGLLARMLLVTVAVAAMDTLKIAPPLLAALLSEKVLFVTVRIPPFSMAPPSKLVLPEKVLLATVKLPKLAMAPA